MAFMTASAGALLLHSRDMVYAHDDSHQLVDFLEAYSFGRRTILKLEEKKDLVEAVHTFFREEHELFMLHLIFHGHSHHGAWLDSAGNSFCLSDVLRLWHLTTNSRDAKKCLLIILDSCHSGYWVHELAENHRCLGNVCIQAAAGKFRTTADDLHSFTFLWVFLHLPEEYCSEEGLDGSLARQPYLEECQPCYIRGQCCQTVCLNGREIQFLGEEVTCSNHQSNLCDLLVPLTGEVDDLFALKDCKLYFQQIQIDIWEHRGSKQDIIDRQNRKLAKIGSQAKGKAFVPALEELTAMLNISDLDPLLSGCLAQELPAAVLAPQFDKLNDYKLSRSYERRKAHLRQNMFQELELLEEPDHFHILELLRCCWKCQLSLCYLCDTEDRKLGYRECLKQLQEMLNLTSHHVGAVARLEVLDALALYIETMLNSDELIDLEKLAGEDLQTARARMHRELAGIYDQLEVGMRDVQFQYKLCEYGTKSLQHRAACCEASEFHEIEKSFNTLLRDVEDLLSCHQPEDGWQAGVTVRIGLVEVYATWKGNPEYAKKHTQEKSKLLQDWHSRPDVWSKRKMPFWLESFTSLTLTERREWQAKAGG
ncbi:unnamed protein product [Symbiodinium sp. CCMP2592]|nr:unnamed protein product [Symbiodinium sp. CCMP2592]